MSGEVKFGAVILAIGFASAVAWFAFIGPWLESMWGYGWGTAFAFIVAIVGYFATFAAGGLLAVRRT